MRQSAGGAAAAFFTLAPDSVAFTEGCGDRKAVSQADGRQAPIIVSNVPDIRTDADGKFGNSSNSKLSAIRTCYTPFRLRPSK